MNIKKESANQTKIFFISFLSLFAEMALIRWISSEIRIFAYVSNLALLATFLGLGFGCWLSHKKPRIFITFGAVLLFVTAVMTSRKLLARGGSLARFLDLTSFLGQFSDTWVATGPPTGLGTMFSISIGIFFTLGLFFLIMISLIPMGQILGQLFQVSPNPLTAYSINLVGSLAGIWSFYGTSAFSLPPWIWFLLLGVGLMAVQFRARQFTINLVLMGLILGVLFPWRKAGVIEEVWSPYYKITVSQDWTPNHKVVRGYTFNINHCFTTGLLNLSSEFIRANPQYFVEVDSRFSGYNLPFEIAPGLDSVLIIGSGGGNDVAGALRHGAQMVHAVEIDSKMVELGRKYHPELPYQDPRVKVFITDARSFFKQQQTAYDLIFMNVVYSHSLSSNFQPLRLDDYLYTSESFKDIARLLKKDGVFILRFFIVRPWSGEHLAQIFQSAFGHPAFSFTPVPEALFPRDYGHVGSLFVIGKYPQTAEQAIGRNPDIRDLAHRQRIFLSGRGKMPTDDWPYFYLDRPRIPKLHGGVLISLILLLFLGQKLILDGAQRIRWHFFFLGAGFFLLEVQNVSKMSLLFGATWRVTAFTVSWILFLAFLGNWIVAIGWVNQRKWPYLCLLATMIANFFLPLSVFNSLSYWPRMIIAGGVLNLPIFFAGLIFPVSWRETASRDLAFGSNLLGAACGGVLEVLSFLFGIKSLLLIVVLLYFLSILGLRRSLMNSTPASMNQI